MKPIDYAKASGLGAVLVVVNLLILVGIVFAYSVAIEPGHPSEFYSAAAPRLGAWSGPIGGVVLLFGASWLLGRRRPERSAVGFALVMWLAYAVVDVAIGLPMAGLALFSLPLAGSLGAALVGALAGGFLAAKRL
ncbi:MAG: hypothetical protein ABW360_02815 [Phenylobacterium sp.]